MEEKCSQKTIAFICLMKVLIEDGLIDIEEAKYLMLALRTDQERDQLLKYVAENQETLDPGLMLIEAAKIKRSRKEKKPTAI